MRLSASVKAATTRDRPGFVRQPQRRFEARSSSKALNQRVLVPGVHSADRLADRPGRERVGIAQSLVQRGLGRGVTQPSESDRCFSPHCRIAIGQELASLAART